MDELEPPSLEQVLAEITPPAQLDLEQAIAQTEPAPPDNIGEIETGLEQLNSAKAKLEEILQYALVSGLASDGD